MHPCLHIAEIVLNIVEKADEIPRDDDWEDDLEETSDDDDGTSIFNIHGFFECYDKAKLRRDPVLSLALVCKAFHQQAISVLWRELTLGEDIDPIVKCFRDHVWVQKSGRSRFLYPKSLAQNEWDNFLLHASKVRKLTFECGTQGSSGSGLGSLSMRRPVPILFPALTTLEWKGGSAKEIRHTKLFISQSLLSVKLEDIQSDAVCTLIKSLATKCPRLRSLHIGPAPQHKDLVPTTLSTFDSKFPHLRSITSNMLFLFPTLAGLALLPKLTTLSCEILAPIRDMWSHNRAADEPFFPLLRDFSVVVHRSTPDFVKFVDSLANSPIQVFRITFVQSPLPPYLTTLFRSLSKFDALLHLYISVPIGHRTPDVIYETALIPLSPLRLITLDLSSVPFVLNDESLERIGAAFTDVTCLKLGNLAWPDPAADRSTVTYDGLLNLASFCPKLRFLGLPVDLNRLSRDSLLTPHPRPCLTLERIDVPCEEARDPTTIAAVVSATLPNAQFVPSNIPRNNILVEVLESWNEVNRQKDIFFLARQQTWATNG